MRKLFFVVFVLVNPVFCWGQGENNIWHFGHNAGIDFNSGSAVAIAGYVNTGEGSASVCNSSGTLLFSTDGKTVYRSNGTVMGTRLNGNISTTQSALIVPFPGNISKYYIFTADYEAHPQGICYSVVDMNLNGGLGGLISINNQLLTPACEKLIAVKNCNGTDYWIIVHAYPSNEFYVYPLTQSGVGIPVITAIGLPISNAQNAIGYLKSSPNGQKLALVRNHAVGNPLEMFDFNVESGILSNYFAFWKFRLSIWYFIFT